MRRMSHVVLALVVAALILPNIVFCQEMSSEEIQKELRALKSRIDKLEDELSVKDRELKKLQEPTATSPDMPRAVKDEKDGGLFEKLKDRVSIGGLIETGAGYEATNYRDGSDDDAGDINLTTVEIGLKVAVHDWVNLETVFLYEDPFEDDESGFDLDVGTVTFGNPEKCPFYVTAGKMFVPFGALLTHLPDDPAVDQPMTLLLGEASEKAVLAGFEHSGISISGYIFNGDMDESTTNNTIETFGFDVNYNASEKGPVELLVGASYISNIADSDGLTDYLQADDHPTAAVEELKGYVGGIAAYLHLGFNDLFFDVEYMSALEAFDPTEIATTNGSGAEPAVWNLEAGYNWNWGRNLEIVLKYAGSDETEALGFPENRYGIGFNQEIFEGIIGSVALFRDKYHSGDVDERDDGYTALGQIAIEF